MKQAAVPGRMRAAIQRARTYFHRDLWVDQPLAGAKKAAVYVLRSAVLVVEGAAQQDLMLLAGALTYKVVFAIVPLFAVMLAVVKSVGGEAFLNTKIEELLVKMFSPDVALLRENLLDPMSSQFENLSAATIGVAGFLLLAFTAIRLMTQVEKSFNAIWGVRRPRTWIRRITVYWALLTLGPVFMLLTLAASTAVQNQAAVAWFREAIPVFDTLLLSFMPVVVTWGIFATLYLIMPNTQVHVGPALIGAVIAGSAWEAMKRLFVYFNANIVAQHQVLGSLAAIPVFLFWIYLSWVVVLFGAEVAFAVQHVRTYRREVENPTYSQQFREALGLALALEIAGDHRAGKPPASAEELAERVKAPVRPTREVLFELSSQGVLLEADVESKPAYVPGRDIATLTARSVLEALRTYGATPHAPVVAVNGSGLGEFLAAADRRAGEVLESKTLRDLLDQRKG